MQAVNSVVMPRSVHLEQRSNSVTVIVCKVLFDCYCLAVDYSIYLGLACFRSFAVYLCLDYLRLELLRDRRRCWELVQVRVAKVEGLAVEAEAPVVEPLLDSSLVIVQQAS